MFEKNEPLHLVLRILLKPNISRSLAQHAATTDSNQIATAAAARNNKQGHAVKNLVKHLTHAAQLQGS